MRISDMNWMQVEAYLKNDDRGAHVWGCDLLPVECSGPNQSCAVRTAARCL